MLVHFAVAFAVVTLYLPMAWDRYLLPIQAPAALLAAGVAVAAAGSAGRARGLDGGGPDDAGVPTARGLGLRHPAGQLCLLLAVARLEQREPADADLRPGRPRHGRRSTAWKTTPTTGPSSGAIITPTSSPGFSLLAAVPYALARLVLRLPAHPLNVRGEGFAYWPADYWVTLGTSGLLTALTGVVLVGLARDLGCGPRRSALVGLAYGLATPAYAYATMSYGHQASAFALLASFALLWRPDAPAAGAASRGWRGSSRRTRR